MKNLTIKASPEIALKMKRTRENFEVHTYRSGGAGGQGRDKSDSGCRIVDKITGISASCEASRSQLENRTAAFIVLSERVYQHYLKEASKEREAQETNKTTIRTYKEKTVTDHRSKKNTPLKDFLDGEVNFKEFSETI